MQTVNDKRAATKPCNCKAESGQLEDYKTNAVMKGSSVTARGGQRQRARGTREVVAAPSCSGVSGARRRTTPGGQAGGGGTTTRGETTTEEEDDDLKEKKTTMT